MVLGKRLELHKDLFPYQAKLSLLVLGLYKLR